jgi:cbb3-type cytochrome oxidase maturation protein
MEVLAILIPVSLFLGLLGLGAFVWTLRKGMYDDPDGDSQRILDRAMMTSQSPYPKRGGDALRLLAQPPALVSIFPAAVRPHPLIHVMAAHQCLDRGIERARHRVRVAMRDGGFHAHAKTDPVWLAIP